MNEAPPVGVSSHYSTLRGGNNSRDQMVDWSQTVSELRRAKTHPSWSKTHKTSIVVVLALTCWQPTVIRIRLLEF